MKKFISASISTVMTIFLLSITVAAYDAPYASYTYDPWDTSIASPQLMLPQKTFLGTEMGTDSLKSPQDIFYLEQGEIVYLADTGNSRILILDKNMKCINVISNISKNGESINLKEPTGIYATDSNLYIADKSGSVYVTDFNGELLLEISSPKHALIAEDFNFIPIKVLSDRAGKIYVLAYGCYNGLMQFSPEGDFLGYYGANPVEMTPELYMEYMWKQILSAEQRENMMRLLPVEYSNLTMGTDGFIYTSTVSATSFTNQIKKLNPLGVNVLKGRNNDSIAFGDLEYDLNKDKQVRSNFIDITTDKSGLIYGLDMTRKRIMIYNDEGDFIGAFGGQGYQKGTFQQPSAVEVLDDKILVLDANKNNLTVFYPTDYMISIRIGIDTYSKGDYDETLELWQKVYNKNINNRIAAIGIGKSLSKNEDYENALKAFKSGDSRYHYSNTFIDYRLLNIRKILPTAVVIIIITLALFIGFKIVKKIIKMRR